MTLAEFKAWFEGFTETLEVAPNEKQWERIKARVAEINGSVISERVFIDRYVSPYRRWYDGVWMSGPMVGCSSASDGIGAIGSAYSAAGVIDHVNGLRSQSTPGKSDMFNSSAAMMDLGKAEYRSLDS